MIKLVGIHNPRKKMLDSDTNLINLWLISNQKVPQKVQYRHDPVKFISVLGVIQFGCSHLVNYPNVQHT